MDLNGVVSEIGEVRSESALGNPQITVAFSKMLTSYELFQVVPWKPFQNKIQIRISKRKAAKQTKLNIQIYMFT